MIRDFARRTTPRRSVADGKFFRWAYYTKQEMADIVRYAQERGIRVVPEVNMPGHVSVLLSACPQLVKDLDHIPLNANGASLIRYLIRPAKAPTPS